MLFSQYKRLADGKLDAANYVTARAAQLIQQTVTSHHSGSEYRNHKLCIPDIELERKNMADVINNFPAILHNLVCMYKQLIAICSYIPLSYNTICIMIM